MTHSSTLLRSQSLTTASSLLPVHPQCSNAPNPCSLELTKFLKLLMLFNCFLHYNFVVYHLGCFKKGQYRCTNAHSHKSVLYQFFVLSGLQCSLKLISLHWIRLNWFEIILICTCQFYSQQSPAIYLEKHVSSSINSLPRFTSITGEPQLHVATSDFFPSEIGWAMTPGCPFRDKFNQQIRRLLEAGLLTRWLNQLIHDPGRREAQESEEPQQTEGSQQPLTLDHVQGAYYVLFIGYAVSGPLFLLELACFSLYNPS